MDDTRKQILDKFQQHLFLDFTNYCEKHLCDKDFDEFITFLIDQDIISKTTIKRYTLIKEFDLNYPKNSFRKAETINKLAARFNVSSRGIWSILKNGKYSDGRSNIKM